VYGEQLLVVFLLCVDERSIALPLVGAGFSVWIDDNFSRRKMLETTDPSFPTPRPQSKVIRANIYQHLLMRLNYLHIFFHYDEP